MAAPTLSANLGLANATGTSRATASVSWQAGDIIVARGISEGGQTGESFNSVPTATGLTFTQIFSITSGSPVAHTAMAFFSATAASSGSSAITGNFSNNVSNWTFWVWVWHNHGGLGGNASTASPSSTKTISFTPSGGADSGIMWSVGDWAGGTVTPSATPTSPNETTRQALGASGANYLAADITDQTSSGAVSYGIVTTTAGPFTIGVVEIKASAGLTVDQETPNWYTDGETASSARSQYTLGTVQFHHEIFVADGFDPGKPILPVSTTSGIWYNEHSDHPNIQGPQHKMQDVDLERWTQLVLLPAQPSWDNDAESQDAQPGNQGIGSDQGLDWTQFIIIPGFNPSVSRVDIDDFSNQFPNPGWAAALAEYETWTQNVLIPTVSWDTDADNQVQQDGYHVNDANLDWTEFVVLQVLQFDPSTSFVDSDVDYQSPQAGYSGIGSDSGQDWVQYILIPAPAWDGDLDHANVNPTLAQGPYFFNDETVGVPIVFIPANGGPAFTLYIPLHQLSALHGLSQL